MPSHHPLHGLIRWAVFLLAVSTATNLRASEGTIRNPSFYDNLDSLDNTCWRGNLTYSGSKHDILVWFPHVTRKKRTSQVGRVTGPPDKFTVLFLFPKGGPTITLNQGPNRTIDWYLDEKRAIHCTLSLSEASFAEIFPMSEHFLNANGLIVAQHFLYDTSRDQLSPFDTTGSFEWLGSVELNVQNNIKHITIPYLSYHYRPYPRTSKGSQSQLKRIAVTLLAPEDAKEIRKHFKYGQWPATSIWKNIRQAD